jgi:site-specific recombinase XerD
VGRFIEFLQEELNVHALEDVQPPHILLWMNHCRERNLAPETLFNYFRIPRTWWNWMLRMEIVRHDLFAKIKPPRVPDKQKRILTPQEIQKLLHACTGNDWQRLRDRAILDVLLDTGMRAMECWQMKVKDGLQELVPVLGKGNKVRVVRLSPEARLDIKRYLHKVPFHPSQDDPLWWGERGPLTLPGFKTTVVKIGRRANVTPLGCHIFRRTAATMMLRDGMSMEAVRLVLGHADYSVLRRYLVLDARDISREHDIHSPLQQLKRKHNR